MDAFDAKIFNDKTTNSIVQIYFMVLSYSQYPKLQENS